MSLLIVSKQLRTIYRSNLWIIMSKESESLITKQYPVKENNIKRFESQQHNHETYKELPECKCILRSRAAAGAVLNGHSAVATAGSKSVGRSRFYDHGVVSGCTLQDGVG